MTAIQGWIARFYLFLSLSYEKYLPDLNNPDLIHFNFTSSESQSHGTRRHHQFLEYL